MTWRSPRVVIRQPWNWLTSPENPNNKVDNALRRLAWAFVIVVPVFAAVLFFAQSDPGEASLDAQVEMLTLIDAVDKTSSALASAVSFRATNFNKSQVLGSDEDREPASTLAELPGTVVFSDFQGIFVQLDFNIERRLTFADPPIGACDVGLIGVLGHFYGPVACLVDTGSIVALEGGQGLPSYVRSLLVETAVDDETRIDIIEELEFRRYLLAIVRITNQGPDDARGIEISHSADYSLGSGLPPGLDLNLSLGKSVCGGPLDAAHSCVAFYRSQPFGLGQEPTSPTLVVRAITDPEYDFWRIAAVLAFLVIVYFVGNCSGGGRVGWWYPGAGGK